MRWGIAEFVAAEEMERRRGYWWSPDGMRLLARRVDERPLQIWHIAPSIDPAAAAARGAIPAGGHRERDRDAARPRRRTDRASTSVGSRRLRVPRRGVVDRRRARRWRWCSRVTNATMQALAIDPDTGATEVVWEDHDDVWTHITTGVPEWLSGGRLLTVGRDGDTRCLLIDGEPATPAGLQVASVLDAGEDVVVPRDRRAHRDARVASGRRRSSHEAHRCDRHPHRRGRRRPRRAGGGDRRGASAGVRAASRTARHAAHVRSHRRDSAHRRDSPRSPSVGAKDLRIALFTPGGAEPDGPLPVLLDPVRRSAFRTGPADAAHAAGVAVVRRPGVRGARDRRTRHAVTAASPGSSPCTSSYIDPALEDQVEALHAAAERFPFLDLSRVAIRGWSYGGYLALGRCCAGPTCSMRASPGARVPTCACYDTHYTERYLGMPDTDADAYENANV